MLPEKIGNWIKQGNHTYINDGKGANIDYEHKKIVFGTFRPAGTLLRSISFENDEDIVRILSKCQKISDITHFKS